MVRWKRTNVGGPNDLGGSVTVRTRDTPKYTSSSDEESSDDEVDYSDLFKGLDRSKVR